MNFIVYDSKGEIIRTGSCPSAMLALQTGVYEFVMEGQADDRTQWVDNHVVTQRPAMTPQVNGSTISGLPQPCTATIDGQSQEVLDGEIEVVADLPGTYLVRIEAFPYIPVELEVTV